MTEAVQEVAPEAVGADLPAETGRGLYGQDAPADDPEGPADEAEDAEEGEEGEQPEPEEEAQFHGPSAEEIEKMGKRLDAEATRHANRLSEIMGESAQALERCELCDPQTAGFHLPVEYMQPESDLDARLIEVLKTPSLPDYMQAQHVRRCGNCDGWGSVLSGSRVAGKDRVKCPNCQGNGFQGPAQIVADAPSTNGPVAVELPDDAQPLVSDDADIWGSPRLLPDGQENPNYGKMPQYKTPGLP